MSDRRAPRHVAWELQIEMAFLSSRTLGRTEGPLVETAAWLQRVLEAARVATTSLEGVRGHRAHRVRRAAERLDAVVGPVVARWKPALADHEERRPQGRTLADHQAQWEFADDFRADLAALSDPLLDITASLARVSRADLESALPTDVRWS